MTTSHLLYLPAELQSTIYSIVLISNGPIIFDVRNTLYENSKYTPPTSDLLSLTAVCRDIRQESLKIFYERNTFRVPLDCIPTEHPTFRVRRPYPLSTETWRNLLVSWITSDNIRNIELRLAVWDLALWRYPSTQERVLLVAKVLALLRPFFEVSKRKVVVEITGREGWVRDLIPERTVWLRLDELEQAHRLVDETISTESSGTMGRLRMGSVREYAVMEDPKALHMMRQAVEEFVGWIVAESTQKL